MRPPGFEPGSSAWKADVLVQARLRPDNNIVDELIYFSVMRYSDNSTRNSLFLGTSVVHVE